MSLLYGLARGHALVQGRRQLTVEDLPIVARAALESTPNDRRAVMLLEDQQNPVALNMEGVPSSLKTTVVDFFGGAEDKCYRSDKFTPKSFVSHSASISREKLAEVDLLPRIRHKVFLVPELAPLFGLRNEDLLESFSILTRVLDGQGLSTDSGVHGRRGHTGDDLFAWIGCTTPIPHNVWKTMGKLGSRFLFVEMPDEEQSDAELVLEDPEVFDTAPGPL